MDTAHGRDGSKIRENTKKCATEYTGKDNFTCDIAYKLVYCIFNRQINNNL